MPSEKSKPDPKRVWDQVKQTDPAFTKRSDQRGGFTSISPMYQAMRATEIFGPCGIGWGWEVLAENWTDNAHHVRIKLWYVLDDQRGEIESFGGTPIQKSGGEDIAKKSLTDAITKALSYLGFSADVFLGYFDNAQYVARQRERVQHEREGRQARAAALREAAGTEAQS